MRGEYKVPGGKLVVVDLEVADGRIANPSVSGDFFLEPDEALPVIDGALAGLPADTPPGKIAEAVAQALESAQEHGQIAGPVEMIGFDINAVAVAVRRTLGHATTWDDHTFEVIKTGPLPVAIHAALDQVLTEELAAGMRGPTLRFWDWTERAVVIGSFQSVANELDAEGIARHDVTVVRRISGGGAMFMEAGNCVTFSLVVPASLVDGLSFADSYAFLDNWVLGALASVGVEARFAGLNDVVSPAGKLAGSAQKRISSAYGTGGGAVLHHMTMAYDIDSDKMLQVLRIGREKLSDKGTKSANKRVDPLRSQTGLPREAIIDAFETYFRSQYRTIDSALRDEELAHAERLVETKFAHPDWLNRVA
ncbi:MAG: lipoate--protein ligase family protein [Promicromonosporaceae bacterium]|nr:lipoate--protein ligase family protein [Promicromonosporaceae bacterium]